MLKIEHAVGNCTCFVFRVKIRSGAFSFAYHGKSNSGHCQLCHSVHLGFRFGERSNSTYSIIRTVRRSTEIRSPSNVNVTYHRQNPSEPANNAQLLKRFADLYGIRMLVFLFTRTAAYFIHLRSSI